MLSKNNFAHLELCTKLMVSFHAAVHTQCHGRNQIYSFIMAHATPW